MSFASHQIARNVAAFAGFLFFAACADWLWHSADSATDNKTAGLAQIAAILVAVISACFLGVAPALHHARSRSVRIIAVLPMAALVFVGVWLALMLVAEIGAGLYDRERHVPPDWLGGFVLYAATLLSLAASIYYVYRDLRKGSNKITSANGHPR
jgi:cytochrome bd-type quinol oxidase subunit 2